MIAAQLVHAAGESSPGNLDAGTYAVVLSVPNEAGLLEVERELLDAGVTHRAVREPDAPYLGALMSIGVSPMAKSLLSKIKFLKKLPLLRG